MYSINFTKNNTKFCLSLHYNEANSSFIGYIYDFSVGYDAISVDDIKDIHKYLMKKNNMIWYDMSKNNIYKSTYKKCLYLLKKYFILDPYFYQV